MISLLMFIYIKCYFYSFRTYGITKNANKEGYAKYNGWILNLPKASWCEDSVK